MRAEPQRVFMQPQGLLRISSEACRLPEPRVCSRRKDAREIARTVVLLMQTDALAIRCTCCGKKAVVPRVCSVNQRKIRLLRERRPCRLVRRADLVIRRAHQNE